MANPNNAVGTNGAFGGRTSVNALNDALSTFKSRGIIQGWACAPVSGMTVGLGGVSGTRDVAIAEDNNGNKTTVNNISGLPVEVALEAAPATNNRLDVIVAYVANPPQGNSTEIDNPDAVSVIVVSSAVAASPIMPTDAEIRSAITADGTAGSNAYYVILATVNVVAGATDITANYITAGDTAKVGATNVDYATIGSQSTTLSSLQTTSSATLTPMLTLTISEAGTYLVRADGGAFSADAPGFMIALGANKTADEDTRQLVIGNADNSSRQSVSISKAYTVKSGDTISVFLATNGSGKTATFRAGFTLSAIRIG